MNLLVTGAWQSAHQHLEALREMGHSIVFMQQEAAPLPVEASWVEGVICNGLFLHHPLSSFTRLRHIQLTSAGFDRVDMDYVQQHGISIYNAGNTYAIPMAEHAICGVLMLYRKMHQFHCNQQLKRWNKERSLPELCGKQVLILGCGAVGLACATRFAALGCHVTGIARTARPISGFESVHPLTELEQLLPTADVVVIALPATAETHHLFGGETLSQVKSGAVLVNLSRGTLIDETALLSALHSDKLSGAVLDVFEIEPLPETSPLWEQPNIILTPHNSFVGEGNAARLSALIISNISAA